MINSRGRIFAGIIALIGIISLILQSYFTIHNALERGETLLEGIFILLGYFTILTNAWVAWVMTRVFLKKSPGGEFTNTSTLSATALYIGIVGMIYHFILSSEWHLEGWPKAADTGLHYLVPIFTVTFWVFFVPKKHISYRSALIWMLYPLSYCAYSLIRGTLTGWYPYPFIRASEIGWSQTFFNSIALSILFYILGLGVIAILQKIDSKS